MFCATFVTLATVAQLEAAFAETACEITHDKISAPAVQQARAELGSTRHRTAFARVDCAEQLIESLKLFSLEDCDPACLRELIGLYKDSALHMRRAQDISNDPTNKEQYGSQEIQTRAALHSLLKNEAKGADPMGRELRRNFAELADAYELSDDAYGYHEFISGDEIRASLGPKAIEVWARALRSCSKWDFKAGRNRDGNKLREVLCTAPCEPELKKLKSTLAETTPDARIRAESLVPAVIGCTELP